MTDVTTIYISEQELENLESGENCTVQFHESGSDILVAMDMAVVERPDDCYWVCQRQLEAGDTLTVFNSPYMDGNDDDYPVSVALTRNYHEH